MMNSGPLAVKKMSVLGLAMHRSFSRSTLGLRLTQDVRPDPPEKSWVNTSCLAIAMLGIGFSIFSTRQLYEDPKRQCLLWKKSS